MDCALPGSSMELHGIPPECSMAFSRQEYWSGLPFPSPEDLSDPGIKPRSPALQADSLLSELQGRSMTNLDRKLKNRYYFTDNGLYIQSYGFSSSHVWMWELDHKESWGLKNWCFWTVVLKKLKCPLDNKEIKLVNSKGNQSWIFIGRNEWWCLRNEWCWSWSSDTLATWCEELTLEKTLMLGKIEGRRRGWQRMRCFNDITVNGHEFEQTLGVGDGQGILVCCDPWGCKESDMTEWLNWLTIWQEHARYPDNTFFEEWTGQNSMIWAKCPLYTLSWLFRQVVKFLSKPSSFVDHFFLLLSPPWFIKLIHNRPWEIKFLHHLL